MMCDVQMKTSIASSSLLKARTIVRFSVSLLLCSLFFYHHRWSKAELIEAFPFSRLADGKEAAELIVVSNNHQTKQEKMLILIWFCIKKNKS